MNRKIADYLHEWYEQAANRHDKLQFVYRRALMSVLEHPDIITEAYTLESLRGIGPGIRSRIEKRLLDNGHKLTMANDTHGIVEEYAVATNSHAGGNTGPIPSPLSRAIPATSRRRITREPKEYIPAFRSGPYAMLIALYVASRSPTSRGYLLRMELAGLGQSYCTSPIDEGAGNVMSPLQGAIKTLTRKGLVDRTGHPARFALTAAGQTLAERLWNTGERRSSAPLTDLDGYTNDRCGEGENDVLVCDANDNVETYCLEAGQYDIILLVDTREVRSVDERNYFVEKLRAMGVRCEQRSMELGDFLWIARDRNPRSSADEVVLDYVIERKLESDLIQSITDGRFLEQKFRLRNSELKRKIYLVEHGDDTDFGSVGQERFGAAIIQTQIVDGFYLRYTGGMEDSIRFLGALHDHILSEHEGSDLWAGAMPYPLDRSRYLGFLAERERMHGQRHHQTYGCYTQLNHKSANLTLKELFMKQLMCIRQLTVDKASLLVNKFPTFVALYRHYQSLGSEREREEYFKDWTIDGGSQRRFGPALSKRIYQLFCGRSYEEFLATDFGDSERKNVASTEDVSIWSALVPMTGRDASRADEFAGDASKHYRDPPSCASQTQSQAQLLSFWRPEFETPYQNRTFPLLPTSPHSMNLFDDWEEEVVVEGTLGIRENSNRSYGGEDGYDYLDDDELACLPSQLRLSQSQTLPLPLPFPSSPTARRPKMGQFQTNEIVMPVEAEMGGFMTAAGRQIAPPSEEAWTKVKTILDMVDGDKPNAGGTPPGSTKIGTSSGILGGFSTAAGKKIASPSKEAKARAQILLNSVDQDVSIADKLDLDQDAGNGVVEATNVPTNLPLFATASGKQIASPSKEAKHRAQSILSLDDQVNPQAKETTSRSLPQMSLFSTASGKKVKAPKKESVAFAAKLMSTVAAEGPLPRRSSAPSPVPKIQFAPKRGSIKPLAKRSPALCTPLPVTLCKAPTSKEPKLPLSTFLRPSGNLGFETIKPDFSVREEVNKSRSLWSLASDRWLQNHVMFILWKMLAYHRAAKESFREPFLRPSYFIAQINHRYEREFVHAHRSILKRICERDDSPSSYLVLFLQSIARSSEGGNKAEIVLSDGWYSLPAIIDEKISRLVTSSRLKVGVKLKICMAQIVSNEACDVLEASSYGVKLKIHGNSIAPARWDACLGKQKTKLFTMAINSLCADGGTICCLEVVILRKYPIKYTVEYESGRRKSLSRADLERLDNCAFHMDTVIETDRDFEHPNEQGPDRIVSVRAPTRFLVQDNCPSPKSVQAFVTLWDANDTVLQRMQEGIVVRLTGLRPLIQRRRGLLQLASTRNNTRVIFTQEPPRHSTLSPINPLCAIRMSGLETGTEGDLSAHILVGDSDQCWVFLSETVHDGLAFVRAADGVKMPFVAPVPYGKRICLLDVSFLYRDPRHGFPVFLFGEMSQTTTDPFPSTGSNGYHGEAEQDDKMRAALQQVKEITNQL